MVSPSPLFDRRLLIAAGSKGQSGKTTFVLSLIDWLLAHPSRPILAIFDPDREHKTLERTLSPGRRCALPPPHVFKTLDWRDKERQLVVVDEVVSVLCQDLPPDQKPMISILDGVANQASDMLEWVRQVDLFATAADMGIRVTMLVCVDKDSDSTDTAISLLEEVGPRADFIIVRNMKHGGNEIGWDIASSRGLLLEKFGTSLKEVTVPCFTPDIARYANPAISNDRLSGRCSLAHVVMNPYNVFMAKRAVSLWRVLDQGLWQAESLLLPPQMLKGIPEGHA